MLTVDRCKSRTSWLPTLLLTVGVGRCKMICGLIASSFPRRCSDSLRLLAEGGVSRLGFLPWC